MTDERVRVSVFDEAQLHRLRAAGYQEVEIVRDDARHEFLILERTTDTGRDMNDFIRDQAKVIGSLGGAWMMHGDTGDYGSKVGLGFLEFYVLGRGGVLGNVEPDVVVDAFYFFEPNLIANTWTAARAKMEPSEASKHYSNACAQWGRNRLAGVASLDDLSKLAQRVIESSETNGALFNGWKHIPLPDDAPGRAMLLLNVLREMRGGAHIEAVKQVGIDRRVALATNSPNMYRLFGWTDEPPAPDPGACARAEDLTDELLAPAFAALSDDERELFARVVADVGAAAG
jgi:hypothetical protein